jgi:hypothetical protein
MLDHRTSLPLHKNKQFGFLLPITVCLVASKAQGMLCYFGFHGNKGKGKKGLALFAGLLVFLSREYGSGITS